MAFLGFGKKKEAAQTACAASEAPICTCGDAPKTSTQARFIVLGACCQKSSDTFANVQKAVLDLGFSDEVVNIGDPVEIAKYGVMQTPALVVDQKVRAYGRLLHVEDAKRLIEQAGVQA